MAEGPSTGDLLRLVVPALVVGVGSSLSLLVVSWVSERLQHGLWDALPSGLGVSGDSGAWTILILTCVGVLAGLVVWKAPGHAGPDPATEGLVAPAMPLGTVPGLVVTTVLTLAGGVSLGPENPIVATNVALSAGIGRRLVRALTSEVWLGLAVAGTVGAMFGTPVAAALILSEMPVGKPGVALWDKLFAPLVAAGAGALTTVSLAQPTLAVSLPAYRGFKLGDVVSGSVVGVVACLAGLAAIYAFPYVHGLFARVTNPVPRIAAGGLVLGLLGALGGQITLFKGLDEMKTLAAHAGGYSGGRLLLIVVVKLAALVVAASCGFRGGRIFPSVFIGVAIGLLAAHLVAGVPSALAVSCAVLGILLAVTRQGWLSLFMAVTTVSDIRLLPVLCFVILPVWLLAKGRPEMLITVDRRPR
jgi:H+/Cl- antiporter ClcA